MSHSNIISSLPTSHTGNACPLILSVDNLTVQVASACLIRKAVEQFNLKYHLGFEAVQDAVCAWLTAAEDESAIATANLATVLIDVLQQWHAGRQNAPKLRSLDDIQTFLSLPRVKLLITQLRGACLDNPGPAINAMCELNALSSQIFVTITRQTYTSKTVLLLTGFGIGTDSNVRKGLKKAGLQGFYAALALGDEQKVRSVTTLLYRIWPLIHKHIEDELISSPKFTWLLDHPGRLMDILLFQQGKWIESERLLTVR